jgi:hypothetical protein
MKTGIELINDERKRQIEFEGFTAECDSQYTKGELFYAGCCYHSAARLREAGCDQGTPPTDWPFSPEYWKPTPDNRIKEIIKSGALLQAHVDLTGSELAIEMVKVCAREIDEFLKQNKNEKIRAFS